MPRFQDQILDEFDRPVQNAEIWVYHADGPNVGLQAVLTADDGSAITQPFLSDEDGIFAYNVAADGKYENRIYYGGKKRYVQQIILGEDTGGADTALWGGISGDINDQADLQGELAEKLTTVAGPWGPEYQYAAAASPLTATGLGAKAPNGNIYAHISADDGGYANLDVFAPGTPGFYFGFAVGPALVSTIYSSANIALKIGATNRLTVSAAGIVVAGSVTLADEAYGAGWDGKLEAPTKNAVYDKIQSLAAGGVTSFNTRTGAVTLTGADVTTALTFTPASTALVSTSAPGLAPTRPGGTTQFLRADNTWAVPPGGGGGGLTDGDLGDVVVSGGGTVLTVESAAGAFVVAGNFTANGQALVADYLTISNAAQKGVRIFDSAYGGGKFQFYALGTGGTPIAIFGCGYDGAGHLYHYAADHTFKDYNGNNQLAKIDSNANLTVNGTIITLDADKLLIQHSTNGYIRTQAGGGDLYLGANGANTFQLTAAGNAIFSGACRVADEAYGPGWDGSLEVPTKNAVYDKIQTLGGGGSVSDAVYGPSWDGDTTNAPSKNAVYDKISTMSGPGAPNVQSVTTASTVTPTFANDQVNITALNAPCQLLNPTGTPVDARGLVVRIKDAGVAKALSYDTQYRAIGCSLPIVTAPGKTLYLGFIWNAADTKFDCVAVALEA